MNTSTSRPSAAECCRTSQLATQINCRLAAMSMPDFWSGRLAVVAVLLATSLFCGCSRATKKENVAPQAESDFKAGDYDKAKIEYRDCTPFSQGVQHDR